MLQRVAVHLAGAGEQEPGADALGEAQHVERAHHVGLDRLHGVVLVVHGRRRARQVVDPVHLQQDGLHHVVPDHLQRRVPGLVRQVLLPPREEVVHHHHAVAALQETVHQVAAHEPGTARHHHAQPAPTDAQRQPRRARAPLLLAHRGTQRRVRGPAVVLPPRETTATTRRGRATGGGDGASPVGRRWGREEDRRGDSHAHQREQEALLLQEVPERPRQRLVRLGRVPGGARGEGLLVPAEDRLRRHRGARRWCPLKASRRVSAGNSFFFFPFRPLLCKLCRAWCGRVPGRAM